MTISYFQNISKEEIQTRLAQMESSREQCRAEGHAGAAEHYKNEIQRLNTLLEHVV